MERLQLGVADRRRGRPVVVLQYLLQAGEVPGVHVGAGLSDTAQRRWLERALEFRAGRDHEPELRAILWPSVTVAAQAVELIVTHLLRALCPAAVRHGPGHQCCENSCR